MAMGSWEKEETSMIDLTVRLATVPLEVNIRDFYSTYACHRVVEDPLSFATRTSTCQPSVVSHLNSVADNSPSWVSSLDSQFLENVLLNAREWESVFTNTCHSSFPQLREVWI